MAGKTSTLLTILKHHKQLFTTDYSRVLYCMPETHLHNERPLIEALRKAYPQIEIRGSEPTFADFRSSTLPKLVILDDMILTISPALLESLFTRDSHHFS